MVAAFRIPDKDGPKQMYGFVEFDAYDSVDIVVQQREHYIQGHRIRVDLALPIVNDLLYSDDCAAAQVMFGLLLLYKMTFSFQDVVAESWEEHVQRKLQWAIPDEGAWGEANNYELFVKVVVHIIMMMMAC